MSENSEQFLEIDLQENSGKITFNNLDEVDIWLQVEEAHWAWVPQEINNWNSKAGPGGFGNLWGSLNTSWQTVKQIKNATQKRLGQGDFQHHLNRLKDTFLSQYTDGHGIHSKSSKAHYIAKLKEKNMILALFTLGYFINFPRLDNPNYFKGMLLGIVFEEGIKGHPAEKEALKDLFSEWTDLLNIGKTNHGDNQKEFEEIKKALSTLGEAQEEKFNTKLEDYETQLKNLTKTYDDNLALQAPVKYWEIKSKSHRKWATFFGVLTLILMGGLLFVILNDELWSLLKTSSLQPTEGKDLKTTEFSYWMLIPTLFTGFIGIWVIRIFVKLFLSHIHLSIDATERRVMTNTYLSLLRHGQGLADGDKQLILQNLFRSASSGIIKEDSMPPTLADLVNRLMSGRS